MAVKYYFQIDGEVDTLDIDTSFMSLEFSSISRNYSQKDTYSNRSIISGMGSIGGRTVTVSRKFRATGSDESAWNSTRDTLLTYMSLPKYKELYLYALNSDETRTTRVRVYPATVSPESYDRLRISNEVTFNFLMVNGYFEETTSTIVSETLTGSSLQLIDVSNTGIIETPPVISFTPTADLSVFQVEITDEYGFRLEYDFQSGNEIIFDCSTNIITVAGQEVANIQTAGSTFNLAPGDNELSVYAEAGSFEVEFYRRFL